LLENSEEGGIYGKCAELLLPTSRECRNFKRDKNKGLKDFLEKRLLNNTFMDTFELDELRASASKFYRG
jgi:hypothetical protein